MSDQLEAFFGRLGGFADPVNQMAMATSPSCGCGANLGASAADYTTLDATVAVSKMLRKYTELSLMGNKLATILQGRGKIPCAVWQAYGQARQDYMMKATELLNALAKQDITIEQTVWSGGKPVMSATNPNEVKTVRIQAPLRPPAFAAGSYTTCPGVAQMYGVSLGGVEDNISPLGLGFLPVALVAPLIAVCTAATAGACLALIAAGSIVVGIVGYTAYKSIQQVAVMVREYESSPSKTVASFTDCVTKLVASGYSQADAASRCGGSQSSAQTYAAERGKEGEGWSSWTWALIGLGVVVGGFVVWKLTAPQRAPAIAGEDLDAPLALPPMKRDHADKGVLLGDLYFRPRSR